MTFLKKSKKNFSIFLYVILGLIVIWGMAGIFLFHAKASASIYVFPENPKQGDTVFIRVNSTADNVAGNFENKKLFFYKDGESSEWISFLGVDADQTPGDYQIFASTSDSQGLTKEIKVSLAGFTNAPTIALALAGQNKISNAQAIDNIRDKDNPAISEVISKITKKPYFTQPFSSPLGVMKNSGFSFGQFIGMGKTKIQHLGIDLSASKDTEIYAVNDGEVVATLDLSNYGKTVIIDHGLGIFSMYLHLDKFNVAEGDMVRRGQDIGLSGATGYVSGPHLHFSMRVDGARVDPIAFIQATQKLNDSSFLADISNAFFRIFNQN